MANRDTYAQKALEQMPRLLSNLDRNPFSPTFGCFHRDYWLDKTSDFADAVRQFGVHALALAYKYPFPDNIYQNNGKILQWAVAGLEFWTTIQHRDGTFDEFYPCEKGWVGPTAFTTYTSIESFNLLHDDIPKNHRQNILKAIKKAAYSIAGGDAEEDHLANHYALACLTVWKAYELFGEAKLKQAYDRLWRDFKTFHNSREGWSREYDGVDPGYLSATVSFLAKLYKCNEDAEIFEILQQSIEFCSYYIYPNGYYAGSLGSRNTLHFYPHGFEIMADRIPPAGAVAEKMLTALQDGKLVPPAIISDRYVHYRVPEYLLSFIDYKKRSKPVPLPYEKPPFQRFFNEARLFVTATGEHYALANLAKGGVIKIFNTKTKKLLLNDCGIIGQLQSGEVVTSQWIDPDSRTVVSDSFWRISGVLHRVPSNKLFTPFKNIVFRLVLVLFGWSAFFSHALKGAIRRSLILGQRPTGIQFEREFRIEDSRMIVTDTLHMNGRENITRLLFGDEFFVRYVPQSRYFQKQELDISGYELDNQTLKRVNEGKGIRFQRLLSLKTGKINTDISFPQRNHSNRESRENINE